MNFAVARFEQISKSRVFKLSRPIARFAELPMCDKRTELDKKIEHCLRIAFSLNDQLTVDRIKAVIAELEARKKNLHPEQEK